MKFSKLLVLGFIIYYNQIEASQVINIPQISNIKEESDSSLCNDSVELCNIVINNVNKYQQIQEDSIYKILHYLYPILKVFVSNNCINDESQRMQNYINIMSGLV